MNGCNDYVIFGGNANLDLSRAIAQQMGVTLGNSMLTRFSDGEIQAEIGENVRGKEVFVIQPTNPPAENLLELLILLDALKRSSAKRITAVIPYFGYARQDKKVQPRAPITAKLVADLLQAAGAERIITMDLHANQIQGFFGVPVDNLFAQPVLLQDMNLAWEGKSQDLVVVSPDAGGMERARSYAKKLGAGLAMIDKRRAGPNKAEAMSVIGEVSGKKCLIVDDMADTAGTLAAGANALAGQGASGICAYVTHPVLSGPAMERVSESCLERLVATDTIALTPEAAQSDKVRVLSVASLFAKAIIRSMTGESVSDLFV